MKDRRQRKILDIIESNDVPTQGALLILLEQAGYAATQATLSRDIRELRLVKTLGSNGIYKYTAPTVPTEDNKIKFESIFIETIISVDYVDHIIVLKCHNGMANAACAALDNLNMKNIVGSIAGDDTIFVLMRDENEAIEFVNEIKQIID